MTTLTGLEAVEPQKRDDSAERDLVERCRAGEPDAFERIVARYHEDVARVACRLLGQPHDVDDIVQDVFLRVLQKIGTFRADARFSTWLIAITVNCCRSHRRWQALRRRVLRGLWSSRRENEHQQSSERTSGIVGSLRDAVARMPAAYREPIVLRYFEELSIAEIAEILGISTAAVEARLSRGRRRLKLILTNRKDQ
jgi:RNA polymerase sigma-70 factor (ECF subfamily)